jgi:hypothetical protein
VTSLRRRLLNGIGGALLILSLFGAGCQSHTASEPAGKLSREDTIAFLVLTDQLQEFRDWPPDTILCVAAETSKQSQNAHDDPSNALMERLLGTIRSGASNIILKRNSDCEPHGPEWIEKASGRRAFLLSVGKAGESEFVSANNCGQYVSGWHGGALYGGGHYYAVEENSGTITVRRTNCQWAS